MTLITSEETAVIPVIPVNTHPAVPLLWRAHDLVAADPALLPLRHRLAIVATDPSGWEETLRRITRTLRRAGHDEAADHIGHALLLLAVLPSPVATAA